MSSLPTHASVYLDSPDPSDILTWPWLPTGHEAAQLSEARWQVRRLESPGAGLSERSSATGLPARLKQP